MTNQKPWVSPIPKLVHLIWIGDNEYPDYFKLFLKSFYEHLPEFTIKIWNNNDLTKKNFPKTFKYIQKAKKIHGTIIKDENNKVQYDGNKHPLTYSKWAQITDLMRLEIVHNHGGFYFDITFEILKPLYKLFNKKKYRFVGCNEVPRFKDHYILSNSFFGATVKNVILKRLLSKDRLDSIDFYEQAVDFETGPGYLRSGIRLNDNYKIFPSYYFYPFVEEYGYKQEPLYRKSSKNKCHTKSTKKVKNPKIKRKSKRKHIKYKRLKNNKGILRFPCKLYPKSYALKHWQLGKTWLITESYTSSLFSQGLGSY